LLRDLTPEEQELVRSALFSPGPEDDVIAKSDTDFVTRKNMQTLRPGAWLSDEIIHFFLAMLAKRDEELCLEDSTRMRSHFFKSFFMTKLTNEGHQNPAIAGTYDYVSIHRSSLCFIHCKSQDNHVLSLSLLLRIAEKCEEVVKEGPWKRYF